MGLCGHFDGTAFRTSMCVPVLPVAADQGKRVGSVPGGAVTLSAMMGGFVSATGGSHPVWNGSLRSLRRYSFPYVYVCAGASGSGRSRKAGRRCPGRGISLVSDAGRVR